MHDPRKHLNCNCSDLTLFTARFKWRWPRQYLSAYVSSWRSVRDMLCCEAQLRIQTTIMQLHLRHLERNNSISYSHCFQFRNLSSRDLAELALQVFSDTDLKYRRVFSSYH